MKIRVCLYVIIGVLSSSCYRLKDHYRIARIEAEVLEVAPGTNDSCVYLYTNETRKTTGPLLAVKLHLIREYYADEASPIKGGLMMFPEGYEGSKEKISKMDLLLKSHDSTVRVTELIVQDKLIDGYSMANMPANSICRNDSCSCAYSISYPSMSSFVMDFNTQTDKFKGPLLEDVPLLIFIKKETVTDLLADSVSIQVELVFDNGSIISQESKKVRITPANTAH